jgi:hypothetical protein
MKIYYYVYLHGNKAPRVRHATLEQAELEAMRLAQASPGSAFEILAAIGVVRCTTPLTFWMDGINPENIKP